MDLIEILANWLYRQLGYIFAFLFGMLICMLLASDEKFFNTLQGYLNSIEWTSAGSLLLEMLTFIILFLLSIFTWSVASEALDDASKSSDCSEVGMQPKKRATYIAIILGLANTVILFQQSLLDRIFSGIDPSFLLNSILFGGGAAVGWVVLYLRHLKRYGDFFYIFLIITTTGIAWYSKLSAPQPVQLSAVAFVGASLARLAFQYLDAEGTEASATTKRSTPRKRS